MRWRRAGCVVAIAALAVTGAAVVGPGTARAAVDLNGNWSVTISGPVNTTCAATAAQSGTSLSMSFLCQASIGQGQSQFTVSGTINPDAGTFFVSAFDGSGNGVAFDGTATQDSQQMSGTYYQCVPSCETGTFTGSRAGAVGGIAGEPKVARQAIETKGPSARAGAALAGAVVAAGAGLALVIGAARRAAGRR